MFTTTHFSTLHTHVYVAIYQSSAMQQSLLALEENEASIINGAA
jgi:hypothetical protein